MDFAGWRDYFSDIEKEFLEEVQCVTDQHTASGEGPKGGGTVDTRIFV